MGDDVASTPVIHLLTNKSDRFVRVLLNPSGRVDLEVWARGTSAQYLSLTAAEWQAVRALP